MATERRSYTEEFKREAVRLMETSGKTIAELARDLGINDNNLYRWRGVYGRQPQHANNGSVDEMAAELKRLRREVEVLRQERDILKKGYEHCQPEPAVSYQIIEANREVGVVETLCRTLGVSASGYYAWRSRPPSQRQQTDAKLVTAIQVAHRASRGLYGSPRIHATLRQQGVRCSRKRVARLMRQHTIYSRRRPKRRVRTTDSQHNRPVAPNLLQRDFSAAAPNEKWVGDILGIWTDEGWLYLAALLDTYSRLIVGWAMSIYRDEALVTAALRMALARRELPQPANLIQHTDRGSQYTADEYLALLKAHGIQVSMSGKGDPYDNAMMESFFSTLRAELTDLERFATRQAARTAVFEFIEVFYNRQRLHSSLGYRSPVAFEVAHLS